MAKSAGYTYLLIYYQDAIRGNRQPVAVRYIDRIFFICHLLIYAMPFKMVDQETRDAEVVAGK